MVPFALTSLRLVNVACRATVLGALVAGSAHAQVVVTSSGLAAGDLVPALNSFRALLGPLNPNTPGQGDPNGRREITWDGVPDNFSSPNAFPGDFFNANLAGRARGTVFTTPGSSLQVSANAVNPTATPIDFGNIDPAYPGFFAAFSPQKLFTAIGSNIVDVSFFVAGTSEAALTRGFGAVFTDVDVSTSTSISFFDAANTLLQTNFVPAIAGNETFSFLGVDFGSAVVSRVRITSGDQVLQAGNLLQDLVVMDDFIYGEPIAVTAVPEPETNVLMLAGLGALAAALRRRRAAAVR